MIELKYKFESQYEMDEHLDYLGEQAKCARKLEEMQQEIRQMYKYRDITRFSVDTWKLREYLCDDEGKTLDDIITIIEEPEEDETESE